MRSNFIFEEGSGVPLFEVAASGLAMGKTLKAPLRTRNPDQQDHGSRVTSIRRVTSSAIFAGAGELVIEHAGRDYRLRITNKGKLILTA